MNKNLMLGIFAAMAFALLYILLRSTQKSEKYNWASYYETDTKNPFDLSLLSRLLENYFPDKDLTLGQKDLATALSAAETKNPTIFLFINQVFYLKKPDLDSLVAFIERGNQAMIIAD